MDDEKEVSDLIRESVKPREYFRYPEYMRKSEVMEVIRRSCESSNDMKEHYSNYLGIEEMLNENIPPVAVTVMLSGLTYVFDWLQKLLLLVIIYLGLIGALLFIVFTGGSRQNEFYFWLYSQFPENLILFIGLPLLVMYILGICVSIKRNLQEFKEARRVVTTDRHLWEADMKREKQKAIELYERVSDMEALGGIPVQLWMESDRIWGYVSEGSADTLKEALTLLEKEKRAERFGKTNTILENKLQLKIVEFDLLRIRQEREEV